MNIKNLVKFKGKNNRIALVSGSGELPKLIIRELTLNGIKPVVFYPIGVKVNIPESIDKVLFNLFDLEDLVCELKKRYIRYLVFGGKITRNNIIDETTSTLKNFNSIKKYNINLKETDDILLRNIGIFFENQGFSILSLQELIPNLFLKEGDITKRKPTKQDQYDIMRAIFFHKLMSKADIGQSLIVSNGLCIALETLPGTDAMIEFFLNFKNKNPKIKNTSDGIFFKSLKVSQDPRFDFPVIGEQTLKKIKNAKINGLALFENKLILLNKEKLIKLADELDLFIFVVK